MKSLNISDRLEKVIRLVYPDNEECIHGEKGCPDAAVFRCKACEGVKRGV